MSARREGGTRTPRSDPELARTTHAVATEHEPEARKDLVSNPLSRFGGLEIRRAAPVGTR